MKTERFRSEFKHLIAKISTDFIKLSSDKVNKAIEDALQTLGEYVKIDRAYIFQFHDHKKKMSNTHEWCNKGITPYKDKLQNLPVNNFPWFNTKIKNKETIYLPSMDKLPKEADKERKEFEKEGIKSMVCVPTIYNDESIGFVGFDSVNSYKEWPEEIISILKIVGQMFTNAIQKKRTDEELFEYGKSLEDLVHERTHKLTELNDKLKQEIEKRKESEEKIKKLNKKIMEYAEKLKLKIKRIDEKRVPLTDKEKLAFFGLVRYPKLNSKEIGEKLKLHTATVNSIKNRLKKEGYYKRMYIPRLDMMGCELLSIIFCSGINTPKEQSASEWQKLIDKKTVNVFVASTGKESFSVNFSRNLSELKNTQQFYDDRFKERKVTFENYREVLFPTDASHFLDYFNFGKIIRSLFEIDITEEKEKEPLYAKYNLSKTEKILLYGLIKYPDYTVAELSKKIKISAPTICKLRKKFLDNGILKIVNFPDLKKIGIELIYMRYNKLHGPEDVEECTNRFFSIESNTDRICMNLFKNYTELEKKINSRLKTRAESPETSEQMIMGIENILVWKLAFAPMVKKIFDLKTDF